MSAGLRHIQAYLTTAQLPAVAQPGDLAWTYDTMAMSVWRNGGWELFQAVDPAEILNVMTYDFDKQSNILNIPATYTQLNNFTSPSRPAGVFEYGMSVTYDFDQTNRSVYFRFSTNGGSSWNEFLAEPKDVQDRVAFYYQFPLSHPGGTMQLITQMRKEDANGVLNCTFSDVWIRRVA